jgi:hypothetical protein
MAKKTTDETPSGMIGKPAPAFALPERDGKVHKLSDGKGRHVVLSWYPEQDISVKPVGPSGLASSGQ